LSKTAILLMAYGSPEKEDDVEPYYTHIRGGRKPTSDEVESLKQKYKAIGGKSPLLQTTESVARKLQTELASQEIQIYVGMKHWHPYIDEAVSQIYRDGVTKLVSLALAPHYSKMSIGSYQDAVRRANEARENKMELAFVDDWYRDAKFLSLWKEKIEDAKCRKFKEVARKEIFFLFTAHSLPERIQSWGDPYRDQLTETKDRIASSLRLISDQYGFAFQSAGHTSEPWLGPDILDKLEELQVKGWKNILVIPIGFVSDHLEILFDIDIEAKQVAKKLDQNLERTDSFNDQDEFIDVLVSVLGGL
jgi:protoporphyrin/coproporphyrin ferrochelatase